MTDASNEPKPPIEGMTVIPMYADDPLMMGAWASHLSAVAGMEDVVDEFEKDTGIDISKSFKRSPMEMMVDKATGFDRDLFIKWADWVTVNYWGVHGQEHDFSEE